MTFSTGVSERSNRIWGTPHSGQNGEESGTGSPQRWQGCSTNRNYRIARRSPGLKCKLDRVVLVVRVHIHQRELGSLASGIDRDNVLIAFSPGLQFHHITGVVAIALQRR